MSMLNMIRMRKNIEQSAAAFVDGDVGLLILFGEKAEAFAKRPTRITFFVTHENGSLKFHDISRKSEPFFVDAEAEAPLRAANVIHVARAEDESAEIVALNVFVRWPARQASKSSSLSS